MGNDLARLAGPRLPEKEAAALEGHDLEFDPRRAYAVPSAQPGPAEEVLAQLWRRRAAVEDALNVASELYTEAEAAAMQAYAAQQGRRRETLPEYAAWRESQPAARQLLPPEQRAATVTRLLAERAALAEADSLVYAAEAACWAELIALNPLLAVAAAAQPRPAPGDFTPQSVRDGRRYVFTSPQPAPSPGALGTGLGAPLSAQLPAAEAAVLREEAARARRLCVELARKERAAREELALLAASNQSLAASDAASRSLSQELQAADAALSAVHSALALLARRMASDRQAAAAKVTALRAALGAARDAAEQARWDAAAQAQACTESAAGLARRLTELEAAEKRDQSATTQQLPAAGGEVLLLRAALADAEARASRASAERDDAERRCMAAAAENVLAAQHASLLAVHDEEASRASAAERVALAAANASLQAQLAAARAAVRPPAGPKPPATGSRESAPPLPPPPPSVAGSDHDWETASEASGISGTVASLRLQSREEARQRAAANRAKFEAVKAERNALKQALKRSASELHGALAVAGQVSALQAQLTTIQESLYLG